MNLLKMARRPFLVVPFVLLSNSLLAQSQIELLYTAANPDYKPFETWDEEGARDTQALASVRVAKLLSDYRLTWSVFGAETGRWV